ncbi:MAG TPA: hypothetical protein PLO89_03515 [Spirochaetota bacterium]|nr:hypothetical protein [Spirochaetota bacterium]
MQSKNGNKTIKEILVAFSIAAVAILAELTVAFVLKILSKT